MVPIPPDAGCTVPVSALTCVAWASAAVRLVSASWETEAIEASASPRKPSVSTDSSSSRDAILLVAWRISATGSSVAGMPQPLSVMTMRRTPPSSSRMPSCVAPASSAFSSSSLTTEAGRSTTSPAAIWLMSWSGSGRIGRGSWVVRRVARRELWLAESGIRRLYVAVHAESAPPARDKWRKGAPALV
ncbi:hypothetical protein D9M70_534880 [compost metagenome]